jgi:FkbM family methyltransferase
MLNDTLKAAARILGLEVRRFTPATSQPARMRAMLEWHKVNVVLDVGANVGQFARELRKQSGYRGRIVSFEPMRDAHEALQRAAASDPAWDVARRSAIGARCGVITINVSRNSVSSSVLEMLDAHASAAPQSHYEASEEVPLATLDSLAAEIIHPGDRPFLKIDTQGYESEVLDGASGLLRRTVGVQLEMSLIPLYGGQKLMPELTQRVTAAGFELWDIAPTFADPRSGRMLQVDATFFRSGAA